MLKKTLFNKMDYFYFYFLLPKIILIDSKIFINLMDIEKTRN